MTNKKEIKQIGGKFDGIKNALLNLGMVIHNNIVGLNSSKYFAGVIMILLNVGSKFIAISFSKSTEEYLKYSLSKQILVFSMAWLGTRDIYTALGLTAVFTVLSEHLFNEESPYCVVPEKYHILKNVMDTNNDGVISDQEITAAIVVLEKARKANNSKKQDMKQVESQKNNVTMNLV